MSKDLQRFLQQVIVFLNLMTNTSFTDKLATKWDEGKFVCVGLDPQNSKDIFNFNKKIIDQTVDLICCYKLQSAFYEAKGIMGWEALKKTVQYIHETYPEIPVILDAKRGDVENTNKAYAKAIFDDMDFDAVTVHPYLGEESLKPFLERQDKGVIVLVKTSNPGAGEFQDLNVSDKPLYQVVAKHIKLWNKNGNLGVVVGATYPKDLAQVRKIVEDMPILVPGIGAQGGDLDEILKSGLDSNRQGLIISSSREIIFAENPRQAVSDLHSKIQEILKNV